MEKDHRNRLKSIKIFEKFLLTRNARPHHHHNKSVSPNPIINQMSAVNTPKPNFASSDVVE
jgi:hypothetical protein